MTLTEDEMIRAIQRITPIFYSAGFVAPSAIDYCLGNSDGHQTIMENSRLEQILRSLLFNEFE